MLGVVFSIIAGVAMSVQGVMNTRLGDSIGLYEANAFVQGTAFLLSIVVALTLGRGGPGSLASTERLYLLGGVIGLVITLTVMLGIGHLSPTIAISVILIAQLTAAALIDAFGLLGAEQVDFGWAKYGGIGLMVAGVLLFKLK